MVDESMREEKSFTISGRAFYGYFLPLNSIVISTIGIFAAVICVLTMIVPIQLPATEGYINIGDVGVMISGILFGPIIGGISGGVGSAIADIILAPQYAIATLIIKGLEGFIVGIIANPRTFYRKLNYRDVLAVLCGGLLMVFGYLIFETIVYGFPSALLEFFLNGIIQFGLGAIGALLFAFTARKGIIDALPQGFDKIFIIEDSI